MTCSSGGGTGCRHVAHPVTGAIPQDKAAPGLNQAGVRVTSTWWSTSRHLQSGQLAAMDVEGGDAATWHDQRRMHARKTELRPG